MSFSNYDQAKAHNQEIYTQGYKRGWDDAAKTYAEKVERLERDLKLACNDLDRQQHPEPK